MPPINPEGTGGGSGLGGGAAAGTAVGGGAVGAGGGVVGARRNEVVSGSRLKALVIKSADGALAPYPSSVPLFWDSLLETYCFPQDLGLCLPSGASNAVFSDMGCTQRLVEPYLLRPYQARLPPAGFPVPKLGASYVGGDSRDGGVRDRFFRLAAAHSGPVFTLFQGTCSNRLSLQADGGFAYFQPGAEVPLSDFATFTVMIDP
jgi:hypothetical protein